MAINNGMRHPLIIIAVYDLITALHTAIEAFYLTKVLSNEDNSSTNVALRLNCAQGVLACLSLFMSALLIFATIQASYRALLSWIWWQTAYLTAFTFLMVFILKKDSTALATLKTPIQYVYTVLPRLFGVYCIVLATSFYWRFKKTQAESGQTNDDPFGFNYAPQNNEMDPKA